MQTPLRHKVQPIKGMDERRPQDPEAASLIQNWTLDKDGCWDSRIGYEKFFPGATNYAPFTNDLAVAGLHVWQTHNGARVYRLFQQGTKLSYVVGNPASVVDLRSNRTAPAVNEMGPDFAEVGRYLVIVNGHDEPLLWRGEQRLYQLGWSTSPPPPQPWGVDPDKTIGAVNNPDPEHVQIPAGFRDAGLGSDNSGDTNRYRLKYSWVFEDGSESPLSPASEDFSWTTAGVGTSWDNTRMVGYVDGVEPGPVGTVARRFYMTQNLVDWDNATGADELFYYVGQLDNNSERSFYLHLADSQLGSLAPEASDGVTFPCRSVHTAAEYRGALFVAGRSDPFRIYHSVPGQPMRYRATDYFDVGGREGGAVVKLFPYYDHLLVFRQRAVDVIRYTAEGGFVITPLVEGVGTEAGHTVDTIPGVGVVFLSYDGVYLVTGSMIGGATMEVRCISGNITQTCRRLNTAALAKAWGRYSHLWREYHVYFPADGNDFNNFGLVLHLRNEGWSIRRGFPVGSLAVDGKGEFLFGHNRGNPLGLDLVGAGLFVISGRRTLGEQSDGAPQPALIDGDPPTSIFQSAWVDWGTPAVMKKARYCDLIVKTQGNNEVLLNLRKDYAYSGENSPSHQLQPPRGAPQPVWDVATWDGVGAVWQDEHLVDVRFDLGAQRSAGRYLWHLSTTHDCVIQGYVLEGTSRGRREREGRG